MRATAIPGELSVRTGAEATLYRPYDASPDDAKTPAEAGVLYGEP